MTTTGPIRNVWIDQNLMSPDSLGDGTIETYETDDQRILVTDATLLRMTRWLSEAGLMGQPDDDAHTVAMVNAPAVNVSAYGTDAVLYDVTDFYGGWDNAQAMKEGLDS